MKTTFFISFAATLLCWNTVSANRYNSYFLMRASHKKTANDVADTASLNGRWFLQALLSSDTGAGKIPVLQINLSSGTFSGNTGCNNMRGSFKKTDTSLAFDQNINTTKMNCTGYDEAAFIRSLLHTNAYKIEKGVLILMFDATELSRWTRRPNRKIKMNKA
ncbi:MAG: META domain-containing protein [Bacteroidota bacterium]